MSRKKSFIPDFLIFFFLSILLFILSSAGLLNGLTGFFENITVPIQRSIFGATKNTKNDQTEIEKLKEENSRLLSELVGQKEQEKENRALKDQFQVGNPSPRQLLPSIIIGVKDNQIIIDKGQSDGVGKGQIVVYKDNLIGKISRASQNASLVELIQNKTTLTAKTLNSQSTGILKADFGKIILDNVTLSEKLEKNDLVITEGDEEIDGSGFPPGLIIGKIKSINKKPSSLFQTAEIESLVDISDLRMVFVITQ